MAVVMRPVDVVADYVRRRREQIGLTQDQLAQRAGISVQTIKFLETGRLQNPPKLSNLTKMAHALRVPPDVLVTLATGAPEEPEAPVLPDGTVLTPIMLRLVQAIQGLPEEEQARQVEYFEEHAKRFARSSRTPRGKAEKLDEE